MTDRSRKGIGRRDFLKVGLVGTTSALLGGRALAEAAESLAATKPAPFPEPVYRTLGRTGLKVSVVSFGAMLTPEPEVIRVALEHGVNYVDTARKYMSGKNEEIVARAIKGRRDKVFLATKTLPDSKSRADIVRDVEASLKALGTDHIDVIQLHNLTERDRIFVPETREALLTLKKQGKVRFFGVTTHKNQAEVLNALVDDKDRFFDTCLVAYNFKSDPVVGEAIARAAAAGIGIVAMKSQAGGYQTDALGKISPHQAALKWVLQNPHVSNAIPGIKDMSQLRENIAVMGMSFKYADRRILERYAEAVEPFYCSFCGSCEKGCPRGVEIGTVNRALMYAEGGYRDHALARATYAELSPSANAASCVDCASCTARCVNGLDIPVKMDRARQLLG
ncbi:aldo/keto reductase [Geomesophilobacter sediminis]|uniref:Aldo/keto reductase n=1 Tax=Geomesophilobacter sediminis TaxID=2798584 RepID=A0A8J7IZD9_9BACT|nr:aldo/keto reductase [Geomesophilobacter sediminis]MBJ6723448.1 aldo/keto reductase [Geomesophilobacter sediminis]